MMKKLLIFFVMAFLSVSYVNAQETIGLSWDGSPLDDTVTVWVDPFNAEATVF